MKKQILTIVATLGFMFVFAGLSVNAQMHGQLAANIPFNFYAGNQKFTPGEYMIASANPLSQTGGAILVFRQRDGKASRFINLQPEELPGENTEAKPTLIFNHYGSEYFLSEVRNPSQNFGARSVPSKVEKNVARSFGAAIPRIVAMNTSKIK